MPKHNEVMVALGFGKPKAGGDDDGESPHSPEHLAIARDLIDAVKAGDEEAVCDALYDAVESFGKKKPKEKPAEEEDEEKSEEY